MAFNGSGTFNRLYDWTAERDAGNNIDSTKMDQEDDGFATGLSACITKDGQTTITADLPMATYKHTGVGNGTARTHYAALGQAQDGLLAWAAAGGTANAITATYSPSITSLSDGQLCFVRAGAANTTATPTFSPSGLTARTIVKEGGNALIAGDIAGAGHELILRYLAASARWELLNPSTTTATAAKQADVITTRGDIVRGSSSGDAERLAVGSAGQVVRSDGTDAAWGWHGIVQRVNTQTGAVATGATVLPTDNSIPQNIEGDEYMTLAVTPKDENNILYIDVVITLSSSQAGGAVSAALFQDSTAGALAATTHGYDIAGRLVTLNLTHKMTAGTASETTFKVRAGANGSGTTTFNGTAGGRIFGGVMASSVTITEVAA